MKKAPSPREPLLLLLFFVLDPLGHTCALPFIGAFAETKGYVEGFSALCCHQVHHHGLTGLQAAFEEGDGFVHHVLTNALSLIVGVYHHVVDQHAVAAVAKHTQAADGAVAVLAITSWQPAVTIVDSVMLRNGKTSLWSMQESTVQSD